MYNPNIFQAILVEELCNRFLGEKIPLDFYNFTNNVIVVPAYRKMTRQLITTLAKQYESVDITPSPMRNVFNECIVKAKRKASAIEETN